MRNRHLTTAVIAAVAGVAGIASLVNATEISVPDAYVPSPRMSRRQEKRERTKVARMLKNSKR